MAQKLSTTDVRFWLEEVKACEERKEKELKKRNNYPFLVKYYEGDQMPEEDATPKKSKQRLAIINEYFPNTNELIAELMYQNPDIIGTATKPQSEEATPVMEAALQYAFNKLDALSENRVALFDMIYAGFCGVEVNHINIEISRAFGDVRPREGILNRVKRFLPKKGNTAEESEENLEKEAPPKEEAYATQDETYLKRWSPVNIILDYRAERIKDTRYRGKILRMSHAEFSARYPKFKDKVRAGDDIPYAAAHIEEQHRKYVTLYEMQVKKENNKYINFIISPTYTKSEIDYWERPYVTNDFNMKIGVLHEYGKLYPISIGQINKRMQDDKNNYITFMMEVAERSIPKLLYDKGRVKGDALDALQSKTVMAMSGVDGDPTTAAWPLQPPKVSVENKELLALFQQHEQKLWSVSAARVEGKQDVKFAEELKIQEAGFQIRQSDVQEGLRKLIKAELDTLKDIIAQFWDGEYFFKITGGAKPEWYEPKYGPDPFNEGQQMMLNPLTDILTGDYEIDIDISTALKPNKERKKQELIAFAKWITSPETVQFCMLQKHMVDIEVIKKVAKEWGWNPENIIKPIEEIQEEEMAPEGGAVPEGVVPPGGGMI